MATKKTPGSNYVVLTWRGGFGSSTVYAPSATMVSQLPGPVARSTFPNRRDALRTAKGMSAAAQGSVSSVFLSGQEITRFVDGSLVDRVNLPNGGTAPLDQFHPGVLVKVPKNWGSATKTRRPARGFAR